MSHTHFSCSRRSFLKIAASSTLALPFSAQAAPPARKPDMAVRKIKGFCPFCQTRCTYHALVESTPQGDRIRTIIGDTGNRWTGGAMCPKGLSVIDLMNSPHRLTKAMRRTAQGWQEISYSQAVSIVADTLLALRTRYGESIGEHLAMTEPLWDCRESELTALMTMRTAGCVNIMPPGEVCISTSAQTQGMLLGSGASSTTVDEVCNCKTLVIWGANITELYPPYTRWLMKAQEKGVEMIYIDCRKTRTSQWCSRQLMPIPGTDGALALGAIHFVLETGAYDAAALAATSTGVDKLQQYAEPWTIPAVSAATGIAEDAIHAFYATLAQSSSTIVWMGGALSRYTNGMTTVRAITSLQVLTGNMIGKGCGILNMQGGKPEGGTEFVDMLCGKAKGKSVNFRRLTAAMKKGSIDVLFLNSSYRRYPDAKNVAEAIKKVPLVVHRGFFMTEEMDVATLFIPATFGTESEGSHYAMEKQVEWREKIVAAPGDCVPCWQFYRDLGRAIAPETYPHFEKPADLYEMCRTRIPSWHGMTLERLRQSPDGLVWPLYENNAAELTGCHFREGKYLTPDGKFHFDLPL
ncbi:MAG: molybdopterin-dependent oxidoreductase, partial [Desulfovibrionaceae bacterium]